MENNETQPTLPAGFTSKTIEWNNQTIEKIIGPGHNPEEIKFEGTPEGPYYVHCRAGMPNETIKKDAEPAENWFVRFGGTKSECETFCTR